MHPIGQPMIVVLFDRCINQILHKFRKSRSTTLDLTRIESFEDVVAFGAKFKLVSVATNESLKGMSNEEKLCWALSICIESILRVQKISHCVCSGSTNLKKYFKNVSELLVYVSDICRNCIRYIYVNVLQICWNVSYKTIGSKMSKPLFVSNSKPNCILANTANSFSNPDFLRISDRTSNTSQARFHTQIPL